MRMFSYEKKRSRSNEAHTVIKILSNNHRLAILKLLLHTKDDLCVHELSESIGISQSATSHQLAYLEMCGVVESVRTGKTKCYLPTDSPITKKISRVIKALE